MKEFTCLHSGKCCEKVYTQIALTFGDIIRISNSLDFPIEKLFEDEIVGLKPFNVSENIFEYELGLTIPCKFRVNKRCKIYQARPLNCRLFPYWILSELSDEKIQEEVDKSYECVHRVILDSSTKQKYKEYKDKIVEILNKEADETEKILDKHNVIYSIDLTKQDGFSNVMENIENLKKRLSGVELQKQIDELKIEFAIKLIDNTKISRLVEVSDKIKSMSSATVEDLNAIELKRG